MDLQLNGKTALVTGSTAGIGLEIARRLVSEGADVVICGRNQGKLDGAAADVGARGVLADPATAEGAAALVATVPDVDILVNNLGISSPRRSATSRMTTGADSSRSTCCPGRASPAPTSLA